MFNIKKRFFKRELAQTEAKIWSQEFARYTTLFERERTRQSIDKTEDVLHRMKATNADKEEIENMESQLLNLKKQIDDYDVILDGCEPNMEFPEGVRGINQSIESQVQKREHIKNFITNYC
jgi:hypothetical protein